MPSLCQNLKTSYEELQKLTVEFTAKYNAVKEADDLDEVKKLRQKLELARGVLLEYLAFFFFPEGFFLTRKDVPTWNKLPSEAEIKADFIFDGIWNEYYEGRKLIGRRGFEMVDQDLLNVKHAENDPSKREAFLREVNTASLAETLPPAKIFDIGSIIEQKKKEAEARGETHEDYLTTKELLEAFEEAGVRPATLKELLAYSKKYWKPKKDPNHPLTQEEITQRANAPFIYALGSVFSSSGCYRYVPCLGWDGGRRRLYAALFGSHWDSRSRFLVFRKTSS